MNTNVVPFPLSRRRAFVWRHASIINRMSSESAERRLARQLKVQYDALGAGSQKIESTANSHHLSEPILAASAWESSVTHEQ
jgi:hypothetical protein